MRDRAGASAFWLCALALSAAVVGSFWGVDYLPTHGGPQHLMWAQIDAHYDEPGGIWAQNLTPNVQIAYRGFSSIDDPLARTLPWRDALRTACR